ncbi:MAG: hypothetical protein AAGG09_03050 [Pseudomonadota bacterium]
MQTMTRSYRSLSLIWAMHRDTLIMSVAIAIGLGLGVGAGSALLPSF